MKQQKFVETSVFKVLKSKGYGDFQARQGADAAGKFYSRSSNFKPGVIEACTQYAVRSIGNPQK